MATRAIVEIKGPRHGDKEEVWRLYCHSDGYPEGLGVLVREAIDRAMTIDPNFHGDKPPADQGESLRDFVPNAACESDKFTAFLCGHLWERGYVSAYLTKRDPLKEREKDGWTDIDYLYRVELYGHQNRRPSFQAFHLDEETKEITDKVEKLYEEEG